MKANLLQGEPARSASYVSKYMTKNDEPSINRVRASFHYGGNVQGDVSPSLFYSKKYTSTPVFKGKLVATPPLSPALAGSDQTEEEEALVTEL